VIRVGSGSRRHGFQESPCWLYSQQGEFVKMGFDIEGYCSQTVCEIRVVGVFIYYIYYNVTFEVLTKLYKYE